MDVLRKGRSWSKVRKVNESVVLPNKMMSYDLFNMSLGPSLPGIECRSPYLEDSDGYHSITYDKDISLVKVLQRLPISKVILSWVPNHLCPGGKQTRDLFITRHQACQLNRV